MKNMNAIQEAIRELDGKIQQYTNARDALLIVFPRDEIAVVVEPGTDAIERAKRGPCQKRGMKPLDIRRVAAPAVKAAAPLAQTLKNEKKQNKAEKPAPTAPPAPGLVMTFEPGEKPDTVGGALKVCAKKLKKFTVSQLLDMLKADADWNKLLEDGNPTSPYSSIAYWASKGRLNKVGDGASAVYTVVDLDF